MNIDGTLYQSMLENQNCLKISSKIEFPVFDNFNGEKDLQSTREQYRKRIEPWLSAALQTEHLSMLIGTGLTIAICSSANVKSSSMAKAEFGDDFSSKINSYAENAAKQMGRGNYNIEDQIRTALSLLHGYEIDNNDKAAKKLGAEIDIVLTDFSNSILEAEKRFMTALESSDTTQSAKAEFALFLLKSFITSFSSRTATRERTHIFTTNYDRFIELACDYSGIKILDRFWGKIVPRFQESPATIDYYYRTPDAKNEFRYAEGVVRYSKIHGSVDWVNKNNTIYKDCLRFGAEKVELPKDKTYRDHLMIYPNSMKSVETALYPYSELFRDFSSAICRPNSTLVTYGYGFGDTHINKIIKEMLSTPSTHLIIISYGIDERLVGFLRQINLAQITLLCGSEFGSIENLVQFYLPKAAIDTITESASKLVDARKGYLDRAEVSAEVENEL